MILRLSQKLCTKIKAGSLKTLPLEAVDVTHDGDGSAFGGFAESWWVGHVHGVNFTVAAFLARAC